jgi:hypothetical protein
MVTRYPQAENERLARSTAFDSHCRQGAGALLSQAKNGVMRSSELRGYRRVTSSPPLIVIASWVPTCSRSARDESLGVRSHYVLRLDSAFFLAERSNPAAYRLKVWIASPAARNDEVDQSLVVPSRHGWATPDAARQSGHSRQPAHRLSCSMRMAVTPGRTSSGEMRGTRSGGVVSCCALARDREADNSLRRGDRQLLKGFECAAQHFRGR